jgi:hypothetical protein
VFAAPWDLSGALKTALDDPTLRAYPLIPGSTLACAAKGVTARNGNDHFASSRQSGSYGKTFVVDVDAASVVRVSDRAACEAAATRLSGVAA